MIWELLLGEHLIKLFSGEHAQLACEVTREHLIPLAVQMGEKAACILTVAI